MISNALGRVLIAACFTCLGGCSDYEPVRPPVIHLKVNPEVAYYISLGTSPEARIISAPEVATHHQLRNGGSCVPIDRRKALGGMRPNPTKMLASDDLRKDANGYAGLVFMDRIVDEDYYGLGVCNWDNRIVSIKIATKTSRNSLSITLPQNPSDADRIQYEFSCQSKPGVNVAAQECYERKSLPSGNFFKVIINVERH